MPTKIYKTSCDGNDPAIISEAAGIIQNGGLVVLPTETVYGIAVNLDNSQAVRRLYQIKQRAGNKPLSIHISSVDEIEKYAQGVLPYVYRLAAKFWPGPLTVVLNSRGNKTVGLRLPDCAITTNIIKEANVPVGMPSANKSGNPATRSAQEALKDLDGLVDLVLDCGATKLAQESTVVDLTTLEPKLLRAGAVEFNAAAKEAKKKRVLFICTGNTCRSVIAYYLFKKAIAKREDFEADSAGIGGIEGTASSFEVLELLRNDGIDATGHKTKRLDVNMLRQADLILVMTAQHEERLLSLLPGAKNKVYLLKEFAKMNAANLDIPDPIGRDYDFYREIYYQIKEAVLKVAELL